MCFVFEKWLPFVKVVDLKEEKSVFDRATTLYCLYPLCYAQHDKLMNNMISLYHLETLYREIKYC